MSYVQQSGDFLCRKTPAQWQHRYNVLKEPAGLLILDTEMDGILVDPAAFKAVVGRAERPGCVRFAHISAKKQTLASNSMRAFLVLGGTAGDQFNPSP